jgi:hypothetical protein
MFTGDEEEARLAIAPVLRLGKHIIADARRPRSPDIASRITSLLPLLVGFAQDAGEGEAGSRDHDPAEKEH